MKLPRRLTDVLSRVRFNMHGLLARGKAKDLETAGHLCNRCVVKGRCDRWIATHAEGEAASPPAFCPSAKFIKENS